MTQNLIKQPTWRAALWLCLLATSLTGCTTSKTKTPTKEPEKQQLIWPAPPDPGRFAYEKTFRSSEDIVLDSNEVKLKKALTGLGGANGNPVIDKPSGIASRKGLIYVAEPSVKRITVFNIPARKLFRIGVREPNDLKKPMAIALDKMDRVYVLDTEKKQVMVFDALGLFLYSIGLETGFTYPVAVAASPNGDTIYVVDRGDVANNDHKVVAFAPDGSERFRLGPRGAEPGQFNIPLAAAVGTDGSLHIVDAGNFRIQKFDANGKFIMSFGGSGAELGRFSRPRAIALDNENNIYVSDSGFGNVQIFNADGQLLMPIGSLTRKSAPGNFPLIASISVDETGRLYILDHFFKKIEVFKRLKVDSETPSETNR
jgi:hypothetical protein